MFGQNWLTDILFNVSSSHSAFFAKLRRNLPSNYCEIRTLACVASVSVGFGSKELPREKWSEERVKEGGERPLVFHATFLSSHFSRGQNTENPVPRSFFAPQPHGNACYAGYSNSLAIFQSRPQGLLLYDFEKWRSHFTADSWVVVPIFGSRPLTRY